MQSPPVEPRPAGDAAEVSYLVAAGASWAGHCSSRPRRLPELGGARPRASARVPDLPRGERRLPEAAAKCAFRLPARRRAAVRRRPRAVITRLSNAAIERVSPARLRGGV